tara:strand:+ start:163 stop:357 length:195 start_codon:yes stop_codon:yes gene_type:complete
LHLLKLEDDEDINKEEEEDKSKLADICDMMMILSIFRDDARCRQSVLEGVLRVFRAPQISFICG